jgi:hypothetical protein
MNLAHLLEAWTAHQHRTGRVKDNITPLERPLDSRRIAYVREHAIEPRQVPA